MVDDPKFKLIKRWRLNCQRSQIANYSAANRYAKRNYWLGIPTVALTAIVGTTVFVALEIKVVDPPVQILIGLISIFSAVLAALQTFLNLGELAGKYRSTAAEYGSVKRQLDQIVAEYESGKDVQDEVITSIREQMDTLSREGTEVPKDLWDKARETIPSTDNRKSNGLLEGQKDDSSSALALG